jgi:hypothetical protein
MKKSFKVNEEIQLPETDIILEKGDVITITSKIKEVGPDNADDGSVVGQDQTKDLKKANRWYQMGKKMADQVYGRIMNSGESEFDSESEEYMDFVLDACHDFMEGFSDSWPEIALESFYSKE